MPAPVSMYPDNPLECGDCGVHFAITPDGDMVTDGLACPECGGKRLFRNQPSPTRDEMSGLGDTSNMVDSDTQKDEGGNPLGEGTIMGGDGEVPALTGSGRGRDNFMHSKIANPYPEPADPGADTIQQILRGITDVGKLQSMYHKLIDQGDTGLATLVWNHMQSVQRPAPDAPNALIQHPDPWMDNEPGMTTFPEEWNRQGSVTETVMRPTTLSMEPYMPWTHEAITKTAGPLALDAPFVPEEAAGVGAAADAVAPVAEDVAGDAGGLASKAWGGIKSLFGGGTGGATAGSLMKGALNKGKGTLMKELGSGAAGFGLGSMGLGAPGTIPSPQSGGMAAEPVTPAPSMYQLGSTDIPMLLIADYESPGSVNSVDEQEDDPQDQDQKEFNDGDKSPSNHENPNNEDSGASGEDGVREKTDGYGFGPNSPGIDRMMMMMPLLLHYYNSDESGMQDPLIKALHETLEGELPGYLDHESPEGHEGVKTIIMHQKNPHGVHANIKESWNPFRQTPEPSRVPDENWQHKPCPACNAPGTAMRSPQGGNSKAWFQCPSCEHQYAEDIFSQGRTAGFNAQLNIPQPLGMGMNGQGMNALPGQNTGQGASGQGGPPGGTCPSCGGALAANGTCPQCGAGGYQEGMQGAVPGSAPSLPPTIANLQGPSTPEQIAAVQQYLLENGKQDLVPDVPLHPLDYAEILAQIQQKTNVAPQVDPSQLSPPPQMQGAPGAMPSPDMGGGNAGGQPMQPMSGFNAQPHPDPLLDPLENSDASAMLDERVMELQQQGMPYEQAYQMALQETQSHMGSHEKLAPGKHHLPGATDKENRMYEHIKDSLGGEDEDKAEAAATVNKYRAEHGETKEAGGSDAHNAIPRCPKCGSATTTIDGIGDLQGDIRQGAYGHCHACGHSWDVLKKSNVHEADANNLMPRCPNCGSATTSAMAGDDNDIENPKAHCHSCGVVFKPTHKHEHIALVDVPNPLHQEQGGRVFVDSQGQDLVPNQTYELSSPNYAVPDQIQVVYVHPDEIGVKLVGDLGGMSGDGQPDFKIDRKEAEMQQYTFSPAGQGNIDDRNDEPPSGTPGLEQVPPSGPTTDEVSNSYPNTSVSSVQDPEQPTSCVKCGSTSLDHSLTSSTQTMHECVPCGYAWETTDNFTGRQSGLDWLREDSSSGGDDFFAEMGRHQAMRQADGGQTRDIRAIAAKQAGRHFTPSEKRELIDEQGHARNLEDLDLNNTHYDTRIDYTGKANGLNVDDDHFVFGL